MQLRLLISHISSPMSASWHTVSCSATSWTPYTVRWYSLIGLVGLQLGLGLVLGLWLGLVSVVRILPHPGKSTRR